MEAQISECLFGKSVYFSMDEIAIEREKTNGESLWEIVSKSDWREAEKALTEADEAGCVLTLLLGNITNPTNIKWIAITNEIKIDKENTTISFSFIEELTISTLSSSTYQIFCDKIAVEKLDGMPLICATPNFVNDYLVENEIELVREEESNKFFFEKCIYIVRDAEFIINAGINESVMGQFSDASDWTEVSKILAQVKEDGRMLNILVRDGLDDLNIRWVGVIDAIEVSGATTNITFGFVDDLNRLEEKFPISWLEQYNGADVENEAVSKGYAICRSPFFVNIYLNNVFCETSVEEFKNALSQANVTSKQREMLSLHYRAPGHTISMATMARLMGYKNFNAANLHYGKFAGCIAEHLGCPVESDMDNISTLAFASEAKDEVGHFQWEMRAELAQALEELGWAGNISTLGVECGAISSPS